MKFPTPSYNFKVKYGYGAKVFHCQDVSGISAEYDVEEVVDGKNNLATRKIPKKLKFAPVTLKRGIIDIGSFQKIMSLVSSASKDLKDKISESKKDLTIELYDEYRKVKVITFTLKEAFPIKVSIGKFNAQENNIAIEELTFIYKELEII